MMRLCQQTITLFMIGDQFPSIRLFMRNIKIKTLNQCLTSRRVCSLYHHLSFESDWIPFSVHDRSYTAQFLTIGIISLMYAPIIIFAIICYAIHLSRTKLRTTNFQSIETWLALFIIAGIVGLMIERSPFFVSHWSDDNRYLTPMIAPSALLCARLLPDVIGQNYWTKRKTR